MKDELDSINKKNKTNGESENIQSPIENTEKQDEKEIKDSIQKLKEIQNKYISAYISKPSNIVKLLTLFIVSLNPFIGGFLFFVKVPYIIYSAGYRYKDPQKAISKRLQFVACCAGLIVTFAIRSGLENSSVNIPEWLEWFLVL